MQVIYAHQPFPAAFERALFLAGPSPRSPDHPDWRPAALAELAALGYDGVVFVPMPALGRAMPSYDAQVEWEADAIAFSDVIAFWVPRDLKVMPAFTTNIEWGRLENTGRVVLGYPTDAPKMRYLASWAQRWAAPVLHTLRETLAAAVERIGAGALRRGGERGVPLDVWRSDVFQGWYAAQVGAGNRLDSADIRWVHRVGPDKRWLIFWALAVDVYVAAEDRNKSNELLIGRPDVAAVVIYDAQAASRGETRVALVREFRSPARTPDGFVYELPGGSSFEPGEPMRAVAAEEVDEEMGFKIDPSALRPVGQRQLGATLSPHTATVFALPVSAARMDALAADDAVHGQAGSSERTVNAVRTVEALLSGREVDWSTLGMVLQAIEP
ncbi:MAG: 8-oxo-dGTP pyrophosphatase MutT (NUDIX family) [Bradymonadia bacterium]|jgi:8-oxo-dGTP pyrophosphatase MutT (NUDIX family)